MKKIILFALISIFTCTTLFAEKKRTPRKPTEEDFRSEATVISKRLKLSEDSAKAFEVIYVDYKKDIIATMETCVKQSDKIDNLTEEQIDELNKSRLAHARKMLDIRENYYTKFKTVLKPSQIERMYKIEKRIVERKRTEISSRKSKHNKDGKRKISGVSKKGKKGSARLEPQDN